jgi:putative flippase GtrA
VTPRRRTASQALRYLAAGAVNTALTYGLLLVALRLFEYRLAYTLVYVVGIGLGYWMQSRFVFDAPMRWRTGALFPLVYGIQYAVGLAVLWLLVDRWQVREEYAALAAVLVNVPAGFLLSRALLRREG